jgi:hypothetical protein
MPTPIFKELRMRRSSSRPALAQFGHLMLLALACLAPASSLSAQVTTPPNQAPPEVVDRALEIANAPATSRFSGPTRIGTSQEITGDVVVVGGDLVVAGTVRGDVVVLNGDLEVIAGGRIIGMVLIAGGRLRDMPSGAIQGDVTQFPARLSLVSQRGVLTQSLGGGVGRRGLYLGGARITIRAGRTYNRTEGLPVLFGPVFQTNQSNPLRFDALGIWRTHGQGTRDELGYIFRAEQTLGPAQSRITLGGSAFSRVSAIESWGLNDLESSLSSLLFHSDPRDYFEERGWSAHVRAALPGTGAELGLEYADRRMSAPSISNPWALSDDDAGWRPLPLIAGGDLQTFTTSLQIDERNNPDDPTDGWMLNGRVTWGVGGDLEIPVTTPVDNSLSSSARAELTPLTTPVSTSFRSGFVDARRYARLSPDHDLALRVVAGGALGSGTLPSQFQHALGGEGSLPGYQLMSLDCGARSVRVARAGTDPADELTADNIRFPRYGCSRFALFQMEYRGRLRLGRGSMTDGLNESVKPWLPDVDPVPGWVVFFNAGRGWSEVPGASDTDTLADVGVGLLLGRLGLYLAQPLSGDGGLNFFVRLQPRF